MKRAGEHILRIRRAVRGRVVIICSLRELGWVVQRQGKEEIRIKRKERCIWILIGQVADHCTYPEVEPSNVTAQLAYNRLAIDCLTR